MERPVTQSLPQFVLNLHHPPQSSPLQSSASAIPLPAMCTLHCLAMIWLMVVIPPGATPVRHVEVPGDSYVISWGLKANTPPPHPPGGRVFGRETSRA